MNKNKKILAVSSAGGHWTQIRLLSSSFNHYETHYVTTNRNKNTSTTSPENSDLNSKNLNIVVDADLSTKFKLLRLSWQIFIVVLKVRPDVVISTGAAPGFFAILFGKLIGAKTIWIDSMANYSKLSISGDKARRYCDLFLTQWPHLANEDKVKHAGSVL